MRILIVGTLDGYVSTAAKIAHENGAKVGQVDTLDAALQDLRSGQGADLAFVDLKLDIRSFVQTLANEHINLPVVGCSIDIDPRAAADAIAAGAQEYVPFPPDPELIAAILSSVAREDSKIIFNDPNMHRWIKLAEKVAPSEANILITGESGTGKEVMARFIHEHSKRAKKPFISVNCAAIPENLLESELFGHEKGAFTGAIARRVGKFEEANNGTLLLDEISEMDQRLQAKLLRAIQEREIDRVGGTQPVKVNIRIIATSNRDLPVACKQGKFREDLFFRINVVNIQLPPLKERPGDVVVLSNYFVKKYAELNHLPLKQLSDATKIALKQHDWPGNVRELENTMHRAVLLSQDKFIEPEDVFQHNHKPSTEPEATTLVGQTVAEVEQSLILNTLDHCLGNRTQAASVLGISIRTLRNKLRDYAKEGAKIAEPHAPGSNQKIA